MTPERWLRVTALFQRARECSASEREALLGDECGSDAALRQEVESLLAYDEPHDPIEGPLLAQGPGGGPLVEVGASEAADRDGSMTLSMFVESAGGALLGETLEGKYRIEALLGRGGMGEVYRATHLQLQREVAVKLIRAGQLDERTAFDRFLREARMVARLRHPNIVTIHDYGVAPGVGAYLVMERLEGRSLRAELRERTRLDVREALELMRQVCGAIVAAHAAGVIHRDLKPDNIFLEGGAVETGVKVLDFGLAKLAGEGASSSEAITKRGAVLGTPAYMAPELCRGEVADARSDVYALGCLLYEMLTGSPPFTAPTTMELLYKQVYEAPLRAGDLVAGLDAGLDEAILGALAKDPDKRAPTAEAFARALGLLGAALGAHSLAPTHVTTSEGAVVTGALERHTPGDAPAPTNLRHAVTRFVGRERETSEVREWLARTRLVTLVGPGGIGKTRLAVEIAAKLIGEYRDGVWLVELAGLADASLVGQTVASALGVREVPGRTPVEGLAESLRTKQCLLVLDNCEHLVEACARLAERLLEAAAGLKVLATSREALGIGGEAVWPVPSLTVPANPEEAFESEAARLLADRASLARPGFEMARSSPATVAELCRRLEGIPLAIELAAARVKTLTLDEILERLGDRFRLLVGGGRTAPTRQQTLRATIDWSYDFLTEEEQALLRRLAVFAGGWTLEGAEYIAWDGGSEGRVATQRSDVLEVMTRLIDKSLVAVHERGLSTRYTMLQMLREYGLERLAESGEAHDVCRRHAEYFLAEAESGNSMSAAGRYAEWLEMIEEEHDDHRSALEWLIAHDPDASLRHANALSDFWLHHGHIREGSRWMDAALERSDSKRPRAVALRCAGEFAYRKGDLETARARLDESLQACTEAGDARLLGWTNEHLAIFVFQQGDTRQARAYLEAGLAIGTELGDGRLVGSVLNTLGEVARYLGEWQAAREFYEASLASHRGCGYEVGLSMTLCNLGATVMEEADLDGARSYFREALAVSRTYGVLFHTSLALDGLGAVASRRGEWVRAAQLAGAAAAIREASGTELEPTDRDFRARYVAEALEHLGDAAFEAALAEGRSLPVESAVSVAVEDSDV